MKRIARLPILAGAIVVAIAATSLAPTSARRVTAQVTGYYYQGNNYNNYNGLFGQGRGYYHRGGHTAYRYSGYGVSPYYYGTNARYGYGTNNYYQTGSRFGYGYNNPYIRSYGGGVRYYQPYTGGVYFGFGGY